jgi:hypothetical protein
MVLKFLKVLLGFGRFGMLGALWERSESATVTGLRRFVDLPLSSFLCCFGHVFAVAPAFYLFEILVLLMWFLKKTWLKGCFL